jgi:HSP20 family molecular chaperone IbpA
LEEVLVIATEVDIKKIEASYEDGILEVILPKAAEIKPKKISISAKK